MLSCSQFDAPELLSLEQCDALFFVEEPSSTRLYKVGARYCPDSEEFSGVTLVSVSSETEEPHALTCAVTTKRIERWLDSAWAEELRRACSRAIDRSYQWAV